jgi:hypothetical protein
MDTNIRGSCLGISLDQKSNKQLLNIRYSDLQLEEVLLCQK